MVCFGSGCGALKYETAPAICNRAAAPVMRQHRAVALAMYLCIVGQKRPKPNRVAQASLGRRGQSHDMQRIMRQFLKLAYNLHKYSKNYADIARLLSNLLKRDVVAVGMPNIMMLEIVVFDTFRGSSAVS